MRLTVLGKSPSWQDAGGACTGYLVEEGDAAILIDCGSGSFGKLRARRDFILETTDAEEQQFLRTLHGGIGRLTAVIDQVKAAGSTIAWPGICKVTVRSSGSAAASKLCAWPLRSSF